MSKLVWDGLGEKLYETGTRQGVVYPYSINPLEIDVNQETHGLDSIVSQYGPGVAWNGLTGVTESPSGAEPTDLYADDVKYLSIRSAETFGGTIEAYTYPDEFAVLDGSASLMDGVTIGQQARGAFGFCYRTTLGNDTQLDNYSYKLHLVYGCTVSPSEKAYSTMNDSPEAITFSWEFETTPVNVTVAEGVKPTANCIIDVSKLPADKKENLKKLEACLYGTETTDPFLPLPDEVYAILNGSMG